MARVSAEAGRRAEYKGMRSIGVTGEIDMLFRGNKLIWTLARRGEIRCPCTLRQVRAHPDFGADKRHVILDNDGPVHMTASLKVSQEEAPDPSKQIIYVYYGVSTIHKPNHTE
jgi:hypothetical protein